MQHVTRLRKDNKLNPYYRFLVARHLSGFNPFLQSNSNDFDNSQTFTYLVPHYPAMIKKRILIEITEAQSLHELSETDQMLVKKARDIVTKAYAPYSGFSVGAAVLLENGEVITGNNQENAAYPSGICAERTAVFYAGAQFPGVAIRTIVIAASFKGHFTRQPAYPCGACRQVLLEARNRTGKEMKVILVSEEKIEIINDVRDLLPMPFENLD